MRIIFKIIKILSINIVTLLIFLFLLNKIFLRLHNRQKLNEIEFKESLPDWEELTCDNEFYGYSYCPNISFYNRVDNENLKYKSVLNEIDSFGARIKSSMSRNNLYKSAEEIFIGDSFIQADEIRFDKTIYGLVNKSGIDSYSLGFSSWNILQYLEATKFLAAKGKTLNIFLMSNDFYPNYYRSTIREIGARINASLKDNNFYKNSKVVFIGNSLTLEEKNKFDHKIYSLFNKGIINSNSIGFYQEIFLS